MISSVPPEAVLSHASFQGGDTSASVADSVSNTHTIKLQPKTPNSSQNSESSTTKEPSTPPVQSDKVKDEEN